MAIKKMTWLDFQGSGLLWWTNRILHTFGWSIVFESDDGRLIDVYPAQTTWLGFPPEADAAGLEAFRSEANAWTHWRPKAPPEERLLRQVDSSCRLIATRYHGEGSVGITAQYRQQSGDDWGDWTDAATTVHIGLTLPEALARAEAELPEPRWANGGGPELGQSVMRDIDRVADQLLRTHLCQRGPGHYQLRGTLLRASPVVQVEIRMGDRDGWAEWTDLDTMETTSVVEALDATRARKPA